MESIEDKTAIIGPGAPTKIKEPEIIPASNNGGIKQTHNTLILRK